MFEWIKKDVCFDFRDPGGRWHEVKCVARKQVDKDTVLEIEYVKLDDAPTPTPDCRIDVNLSTEHMHDLSKRIAKQNKWTNKRPHHSKSLFRKNDEIEFMKIENNNNINKAQQQAAAPVLTLTTATVLEENLKALIADLVKAKPSSAKGVYIKKVTVSSTMGVGVNLDQSALA